MSPSAGNNGEPPTGHDDPDHRAFKDRLDRLGGRLGKVRGRRQDTAGEPSGRGRALGLAFRLATELVVGVMVGGFIGWLLDGWLGTSPLFLIVFLLLGMAAGILNTVRAAKRMQETAPGPHER